jgi:DNA-binding NtrC family response regulator
MTAARILVVDDEPSIRLIVEDTLTLDGHQVTAVENGEAALALVANQSFDLALLDLVLPGMSGMEVLAALRQQSPDTVVILLTAHASLDTAVKALREGAHDYLFKPCKTVELRESVRQGLLKRQRILEQRRLLSKLEQHLTELSQLRTLLAEDTENAPVPATPAPDLSQLMTPVTAPGLPGERSAACGFASGVVSGGTGIRKRFVGSQGNGSPVYF